MVFAGGIPLKGDGKIVGGVGVSGGATPSANRRYSRTISMQIRNITKHNIPGPIIGNITSPFFG